MKRGPWQLANVETLFDLPFLELVNMAQRVHRNQFDPNEIRLSSNFGVLMSQRAVQDRNKPAPGYSSTGIRRGQRAPENVSCIDVGLSRPHLANRIVHLANLDPYPASVPIYRRTAVPGTVLDHSSALDPLELVRAISVSRVTMPTCLIELSLSNECLTDEVQALCFMAGANSVMFDDNSEAASLPQAHRDTELLFRLGLRVRSVRILHH